MIEILSQIQHDNIPDFEINIFFKALQLINRAGKLYGKKIDKISKRVCTD